ncbi:ribonuclease P protein subunit p30 [Coccinella septempunctata]|uniref:ribonuclease P protein subunit p30 n=1 Tax=Coccinella septempunctata TaxID=41139 RepID=UPI001D07F30B|nr:ribonuclease P protein subunit p30 [Coccinella septempunctata]
MNTKGFFDLCIPQKHFMGDNCVTTLKFLRKYGYRTIAINHEVRESSELSNENKKKKKKGVVKDNNEIIPEPIQIDKTILEEFKDMTILNRLTVTFSDKDFYYKLTKSTNLKKYHILAVLPTTKIAFMFICTSVEADIIGYDSEEKAPYKIQRNLYNHLVKKGFFFELLYAPTIEDSTKRKNTIDRSHMYHTYGKSKNIIISSGASNLIHLRQAYDIINLGIIFGLNMQQAKDAVSFCGSELCTKAVGRCHGKSIVMVETIVIDSDISTVQIEDSDDEEMAVDEPEPKRSRKEDSVTEII